MSVIATSSDQALSERNKKKDYPCVLEFSLSVSLR